MIMILPAKICFCGFQLALFACCLYLTIDLAKFYYTSLGRCKTSKQKIAGLTPKKSPI
jgi:hypothetical protein